jgi:hypothetical protein
VKTICHFSLPPPTHVNMGGWWNFLMNYGNILDMTREFVKNPNSFVAQYHSKTLR